MSVASRARTPDAGQAGWPSAVLRLAVHGVTASVFAWPLTRPDAVIAAAVGAATGAVAGQLLARTRLRLPVLLVISLLTLGLATLLHQVVVGTNLLAPSLGPAAALALGDAVLFGLGAFALSSLLRGLSTRRRSFAVLEVAMVAVAFAQLVVAHRQGFINRPFSIADPIIAAGGDPTNAFLAIGATAALVTILLLLSERSLRRSILHLGAVALVLLVVFGTTELIELPTPPPAAMGLGLRGDPERREKQSRGQPEQERSQRGQRNNEQLEFRDEYGEQDPFSPPVAVVLFHDDYSSPSGTYYFRQAAFSQFNGTRLVASSRDDVDHDVAKGFPTGEPLQIQPDASYGAGRGEVEQTIALLADHPRPFALETPVRIEAVQNPDPRRFKRTYRAYSAALTADYMALVGLPTGRPDWSEEVREYYTRIPDDPRYGELAAKILEEELPEMAREFPAARAMAIAKWLGERGTYSLKSRHAGAADPTAHFLFGDMTGYCVHFAHAATYLLRSVGVPARVATGYAVEESARRGGSALLLTDANSHAWPEVYLAGMGWVTFDVAPQTVLTRPPGPPDADLQRLLGELLRGQNPLPPDVSGLPRLAENAVDLGLVLLYGAGALFLVVLLAMVVVKVWRRGIPLVSAAGALPRVLYRAELDRLSEVAIRRRRGESREAFARRVAASAPAFRALTAAHVGRAFGSRHAPAPSELRATVREFRRELAGAVPLWRRLSGLFLPWTWLLSR